MGRLEDVTKGELRDALDSVESKTPAMRLVAAIAYEHGVTQSELAEWFGVERKTIYNWLTRLEEQNYELAVRDAARSGRPSRLTSDQRDLLRHVLREPPRKEGFEAETWTPRLVQTYLASEFEVTYSLPSCRRFMKDAGLAYQPITSASNHDQYEFHTVDIEKHAWLPE